MKKLANIGKGKTENSALARVQKSPFKISIENQLDNKYCFKDLKASDIKEFHTFIEETVGKGLTISEVETLFKRKKGEVEKIDVCGQVYELVHLGKKRTTFRVFGIFDEGYFVLKRIDPKHKTHKSK